MSTELAALVTDFYVNQKVTLKMDVPTRRETVLDMFDRFRREHPTMDRFRRGDDELTLESPERDRAYNWIALQRTALRSGWVNPAELQDAYRLHRMILEVAPYYLSISPLDVESLELLFGFDLEAAVDRNEVVHRALFAGSPLGDLLAEGREPLLDVQPLLGFALSRGCDLQAFVEVRPRVEAHEVARQEFDAQPISVYLTIRRLGPFRTPEEISGGFGVLAGHAERLAEERVIPGVIVPLRAALES